MTRRSRTRVSIRLVGAMLALAFASPQLAFAQSPNEIFCSMASEAARQANAAGLVAIDAMTTQERVDSFTMGSLGGMVRARAERVFLQLLDALAREGRYVNDATRGSVFAPAIFAKRPEREGLKRGDFSAAMERLFAGGAIRIENFLDPHRKSRRRIVRCAG